MNPMELFQAEVTTNIAELGKDKDVQGLSRIWSRETNRHRYTYNFSWLGRPIIQYPQDIVAMQEIICRIRPDLIIETGVAHGGSLVFYASMLELLGKGEALGIDIEIRPHNRAAIEAHPMFKRIRLIEGSSIEPAVIAQVRELAQGKRVLVSLDSNHTHEHVLAELRVYAPLVAVGSYCVVMDTLIEDMPEDAFPDRPWGRGNNPKTAVREFLASDSRFAVDEAIQQKLLITSAPEGYLRRVET